jgi:hypothetical protein
MEKRPVSRDEEGRLDKANLADQLWAIIHARGAANDLDQEVRLQNRETVKAIFLARLIEAHVALDIAQAEAIAFGFRVEAYARTVEVSK